MPRRIRSDNLLSTTPGIALVIVASGLIGWQERSHWLSFLCLPVGLFFAWVLIDTCTQTICIERDGIVVGNFARRTSLRFDDITSVKREPRIRGVGGLTISTSSARVYVSGAAFTEETLRMLRRVVLEEAPSASDLPDQRATGLGS